MAAFDPATIQMLRDLLAKTNAQHKRDLGRLAKFKSDSKDQRAQALRERVGEAVRVARDLDGLVPFMEGLNREAATEQAFAEAARDGRSAAAEVLSATPLAVAFGAAPVAETADTLAVGDVLDEHDPEPPVGTVVMLHDEEKWKRLDEPGEWHWAAEHQGYQTGVWRWRRVTFDGPVTVVEVPGESAAAKGGEPR